MYGVVRGLGNQYRLDVTNNTPPPPTSTPVPPSKPKTGNSAEEHGGAIKANSAAAFSATNTIFLENRATGSTYDLDAGVGGAIYLEGGAPQLDLHGCELRANNATGSGGAVFYKAGGGITVNGTRFEANGARYGGGAIYAGSDIAEVCFVCSLERQNKSKTELPHIGDGSPWAQTGMVVLYTQQ